jgi:hypothetical protein
VWSLSKPTLHVALSTHQVVVAQSPTIWPGQAVNFERIDCPPEAAGGELWRPALAALAKWLSVQHKKPALHIVLSGRFSRWQLLHWNPQLSQSAELAAYAALQFENTYGKVARDWHILHSPQPPGSAAPACAIDQALLESLRTVCDGTGARLISVAPYFSTAFDRWHPSLKDKESWFGVVEADCISLALIRQGAFAALRSERIDATLRDALTSMLTQMSIASALPDTPLPVYLVSEDDHAPLPQGMPVQWLRTKTQRAPGHTGIRMALGM